MSGQLADCDTPAVVQILCSDFQGIQAKPPGFPTKHARREVMRHPPFCASEPSALWTVRSCPAGPLGVYTRRTTLTTSQELD